MNLYTLPLNVIIQIFAYSTKRDRNKHLALVCRKFWLKRKQHFVNVAFQSDLQLKWKQEKVHLRPLKLVLVLNPLMVPSCISTPENNKCFVKSIAEFCKKFAKNHVTILLEIPYFVKYQHYYNEKHSPKIKAQIVDLILKLKKEFDTPRTDCHFCPKFMCVHKYYKPGCVRRQQLFGAITYFPINITLI